VRNKVSVINIATLSGHKDSIYALTGDEKGYIYSAGGDGMIVQWDLSKPKNGELIAQTEGSIYALALFQTNILVIGNNHKGLNFIDLETKKELFSLSLDSCGAIYGLLVNEQFIYAACQNGCVYKIEFESKKIEKFSFSTKSLRSITKSTDGFILSDSLGRIFILSDDLKINKIIADSEKSVFHAIEFQDEIYAVSRDCHLRIYKNEALTQEIVAHIYAINHVEISPNKTHFATASQDKTLKIWDLEEKKLIKVIDQARHQGHSNSVNKLFWSRYDNLLVSCSDDRTLKVWKLNFEQ
jgi:WD40 repeat protein